MKIRKKSLNQAILFILEKAVDGYVVFEDFIYNPLLERPVKKSELSQALKRLRLGGLIEANKDQKKLIFKLTSLGKEAILTHQVLRKPWDGKWRIVIFDIPESHKRVRNLFRRNLKFWEFKIFQKSVWVSKFDVADELRKLTLELGIENWVAVIESSDPFLKNII